MGFVIGLLCGGLLGVTFMCIWAVSGGNDE
ncbi:MAG: DUF3789 domain-containing protein [Candidatus Alkaliphilus sp. MAG34]